MPSNQLLWLWAVTAGASSGFVKWSNFCVFSLFKGLKSQLEAEALSADECSEELQRLLGLGNLPVPVGTGHRPRQFIAVCREGLTGRHATQEAGSS